MNDEDDGFVGIVGLESGDSGGFGIFFGPEHAGEFEFFGLGLLEHDGEGHGEVGREGLATALEGDGLGGERVFEGEFGGFSAEANDGGDSVKNVR